jgi:aryl-alcohol dehydrogenase
VFPFDKCVKKYDFADLIEALADSESGVTFKPVVIFLIWVWCGFVHSR